MNLKTLIELQEKATPGPWYDHVQRIGTNKEPSVFVMISQTYGLFGSEPHGICLDSGDTLINLGTEKVWEENQGNKWPAEDNAAFIAAARNFDFAALQKRMEEMEGCLRLFVAIHTEPAGLSEDVIMNKERLNALIEASELAVESAVARARKALDETVSYTP